MIIEDNLKYLSKGIIDKLSASKSAGLEYKTSRDNLKIPVFNNISLHSLYFPLKEGEKYINNDKSCIIIAIGIGAGYHLVELIKRGFSVIAIPVNMEILRDILANINFKDKFNENFKIIDCEEALEYFDFFSYKSYTFIIHPVYERIFSGEVLKIIKNVSSKINPVLLEINTQRKFGKIWINNIIKNLKIMLDKSYNPSCITIKKKPVLITGAGPSLMHNIEIIKKHKNKLYIAATDSSLKILLKNNIKPDWVFSFDPQHYTYLHFNGINEELNLFVDFTSSLRLNKKTNFLFSNHPFKDVLKELNFPIIEFSSDTRNIGGALIDFFKKYFKYYPLITAGIDYGYYNYYAYSKGGFLDEYKLINSCYFTTAESLDAKIYYKDLKKEVNNGWATTGLMEHYGKASQIYDDVYTLSSSTYNCQKKADDIDAIIKKAEKLDEVTLSFNTIDISRDEFINNFVSIIKNKEYCLSSYLLSLGMKPDEKNISFAVENIFKKLKNII